jgi:hypothetical protein
MANSTGEKIKFLMSITITVIAIVLIVSSFLPKQEKKIALSKNAHISLIGNNLGSRMMNYCSFDTELHMKFPSYRLFIRNLCDGGDTPGFRPHASRNTPWAFPDAAKFQKEYARPSDSEGNFPTPDEWLTNLKTDVVLAFFGIVSHLRESMDYQNLKPNLKHLSYTLCPKNTMDVWHPNWL